MPKQPRIPDELRGRPFLAAEARQFGITPAMLRGAGWRSIGYGVHVATGVPQTPELTLAAVRLVVPDDAVVSGRTAALIHGCDLRRDLGEPCEVTAPRGITLRSRRALLSPRQALVADEDVTDVNGLLVTTPLRTAFDLARCPDLAEGVTAVDALWRAGLITPDELLAYAAEHKGWRGVRQVARVVDLADRRAENPMESRLRMRLVLGGLPRPEVQFVVELDGHVVARLDLAYEHVLLDIEYDGRGHRVDSAVHRRDGQRNHVLVGLGWSTLAFGAGDVFRRGAYICQRVDAVLRRPAPGGVTGLLGGVRGHL